MQNALQALDGKKTWLGLALYVLGKGVQAAAPVLLPEQAPVLVAVGEWIAGFGLTLTGIGTTHKLLKGE